MTTAATLKDKPLLPASITPKVLDTMREKWQPEEFATALNMRVLAIEQADDTTFLELGLICCEIEQRKLWKHMARTYTSYDEWMGSGRKKQSRAKRYAARRAVLELNDIALRDLADVPRCNIKRLTKVDRTERTPKVIEAAKNLSEREFDEFVEKECPNSHLETRLPMRFTPERSQRKVIDTAIDGVMLLNPEVTTREEALEAIAESWLLNHQAELEAAMGERGKAVAQCAK